MGLFDFVKDVGKRVLNTDKGTGEKIKEAIEGSNAGVKNLGVSFERGIVSLKGHCESGAAHKNVVQLARSYEGVIDVDAKNLTYNETRPAPDSLAAKAAAAVAPAAPAAAATAASIGGGDKAQRTGEPRVEEYVIQSGDTLGKLAKKYYGDAMKYPKIFEANRGVIEDPNKIYVGQKIRIPLD